MIPVKIAWKWGISMKGVYAVTLKSFKLYISWMVTPKSPETHTRRSETQWVKIISCLKTNRYESNKHVWGIWGGGPGFTLCYAYKKHCFQIQTGITLWKICPLDRKVFLTLRNLKYFPKKKNWMPTPCLKYFFDFFLKVEFHEILYCFLKYFMSSLLDKNSFTSWGFFKENLARDIISIMKVIKR